MAVNDVSLILQTGQVLAVVGESGSGKSTLARTIVGLLKADSGRVEFEGRDITHLRGAAWRRLRRRMQIVFQDPAAALNPRHSVRQALVEPLRAHAMDTPQSTGEQVLVALETVGLDRELLNCFPHELSGGQRQRVALARALILKPRLLLADEVVSALDVSVQARILNLLMDLKCKLGISLLFISHDLASVHFIADRVVVMYLGRVVESGSSTQVLSGPAHPYTRALLQAVPGVDPARRFTLYPEVNQALAGDPATMGCAYHTICPHALAVCRKKAPPSVTVGDTGALHRVSCRLFSGDHNTA